MVRVHHKFSGKAAGLLALAVVGLLNISAKAASQAQLPLSPQALRLYATLPTDDPSAATRMRAEMQHRFSLLATGAYGKPEDFAISAMLSFKTDKRALADIRPFSLQNPAEDSTPKGWSNESQSFWWRKADDSPVQRLSMPFAVRGDEPFRLLDHDELWVDYSEVSGVPVCAPQVELRLAVQSMDLLVWSGTLSPFKVLSTINASNASWEEKDAAYLIRRELGLTFDDKWRYTQDQQTAVLQRRMRRPLDNVDAIDVVVRTGFNVTHVILRIGTADNDRGGEVIQFDGLHSQISPDGQHVVRLPLRDALEKRFAREWAAKSKQPGGFRFYLQEVTIFVPGDARAVANSNPLHSLAFLGAESGMATGRASSTLSSQRLPSSVANIGGSSTRRRIVSDLRPLSQRGEVVLKEALLALHVPDGATSCAIRIEGIHAASPYIGSLPLFARNVEFWSRRWGDGLTDFSSRPGYVENPGFIGQLFFADLTAPEARESGPFEYNIKLGADSQGQVRLAPQQARSLPYRIADPDGKQIVASRTRLISSGGATLSAEGELPRATAEGDSLVLEGRSKFVDITWPLTGTVNHATWFYLSVTSGAEHIGAVSLLLELPDGKTVERKVVPNQLRRLGISEARVRNVRMRIVPSVVPFRFKLDEMRLFEPRLETYSEAFTTALPSAYVARPKPVLSSATAPLLDIQAGRVVGLVADLTESGPLRFSTAMDPPLESVRGLRLKYHLPLAFLDGDACPLALRFNWANGAVERQLCVERPSDVLFIPLANWLDAEAKVQNLGALISIDWMLRPSVGRNSRKMESFELDFAVEGRATISIADRFRLLPIFTSGRTPVFADAERIREISAGPYTNSVWMPLDSSAVSHMIATGGRVEPVEDPYFALDQIVLTPRQALADEQWRELHTLPTASAAARWPKWLMWAAAILLPLLAWLRGWWSPESLWESSKASGRILFRALRWSGSAISRWVRPWLTQLNVAIAVVALGPGLWMAGRFGWSFPGVMLLVFCGLIAWGAYLHWRERFGEINEGGTGSSRIRLVVLAMTIGCATWSLGSFKLNNQGLWGFLPLAGTAYAFLPIIFRSSRSLLSTHPRYVSLGSWLALTLFLYGLGLRSRTASGENYFFTFGALAAVFLGRASLLVLESWLRKRYRNLADRVYGGAGSLYFTEAIISLIATAAITSLKLQLIAEQLATVAYFCMVIGIAKEAWARRDVRAGPNAKAAHADALPPTR